MVKSKFAAGGRKGSVILFSYLCIGALFAVTRLWQLAVLPLGLHIDEVSMAYSAWCLAEYGVDWHLKSWPVYFINFGGGQNALYIYCCAILFKAFGFHYFLIRLPAVLFSLVNLVFGIKLVRRIAPENPWMPVFAGVIATVCPYFIMAARFGLESGLMLGVSTLFLYCFVGAVQSGRIRYYAAAGFAGGLLLYTYAPTYIILPLFLLLSLAYVVRVRKFSLAGWAAMAVPMFFLAVPLILEQMVNAFDWPEMHIGPFTVTKLLFYRASEIGAITADKFVTALRSTFIGDSLNYNSIAGIPNLYGVSIVLFIIGLAVSLWNMVWSVKRGNFSAGTFVLIWFAAVFFFECHIYSNVNKINGIFMAYAIIAAEGLKLLDNLKRLRRWAYCGMFALYMAAFARFGTYYFGGDYTAENFPLAFFNMVVSDGVRFIEENEQIQGQGTWISEKDMYFALSILRSPYELRMFEDHEEDGFYSYYHCGGLPAVTEGYNYIVRDGFDEYCQELRAKGYLEIDYVGYSLFYQDTPAE
mgnify:CR=1 FL=1